MSVYKSMDIEQQLLQLDALQASCTHCGLCAEACATFQATYWEHESPRGRIRLARELMHGKIDPSSQVLETFDHCLGCHACEAFCPMGVQYGKLRDIVQRLRSVLQGKTKPSAKADKKSLRLAARMSSGLWRKYGWRWIKFAKERANKGRYCRKPQAPNLTLVVGCLQDLFNHQTIDAAVLLLEKLGFSVSIDSKQPCCGAILSRLESEKAHQIQQRKVSAFLKWLPPMSCALSMGCCSFINRVKPHTLQDLYTLVNEKVQQGSGYFILKEPGVVYYQPYCGQLQKLEHDPVLKLLKQVQNLTVRYVGNPYACCGGYAGETQWNPVHAQGLFLYKVEQIPEGSTIIVTSPDCAMQFKAQSGERFKIVYPLQFLLAFFHQGPPEPLSQY